MLKEQTLINGTIKWIDEDGNGILEAGKDRVLVRHVIEKEKVKVKIKKKIAKGYTCSLVKVEQPDQQRVRVDCPIYEKCGSCQLMHRNRASQATFKKHKMEQLYHTYDKKLQVHDLIDMEYPYHYRNKMIIGFAKNKNRKIIAGFYEEFTHKIIPYEKCLLHPEICDHIISSIVSLMEKLKIEPYDEDRKKGLLRHVLLRYGMESKQIMVVLVLHQSVFPARKNFVTRLLAQFPQITTIVQNTNTRNTSVVLGEQERILYGPGYIEDGLCGLTYRISSKSFYQINHDQTEVLYQKAISLLKLDGTQRVLDAYCGIGTIGLSIAHKAKEVVGVEINKDAVQDAKMNAKLNHKKNIHFICAHASAYMKKAAQTKEKFDAVIMDPPRSGSDETFLHALVMLRPKQILYISCNPQTQLRDMEYLKKAGYIGKDVFLVDMFPQTNHVESVVLMSRKDK